MKVLIVGANGYLGPHVVETLSPLHDLRITDVKPPPPEVKEKYKQHEFMDLDVTSLSQVQKATEGVDAVLNLSVVRQHRVLAFSVSALGCYNVMRAAVDHGVRRVINTGPHFTITGPGYEDFDYDIRPDIPPHSGVNLYAISKSLGQDICRVFTENHDIHVMDFLFYNFRDPEKVKQGDGGVPFIVSWSDAGQAFERGLEVDLDSLPSKCEVFFILGNNPQNKFLNEKTRRILKFEPQNDMTFLWKKKPR